MGEIIVSVCCAAYQQVRYIDQAIESFLAQKTSFDFEIIVHDDASSDGTAEAILAWQNRYPEKIHAIVQTENQYSKGVSVVGIMLARARGKYVAICEGDDCWLSSDKLEKQVRYMESHPDCSLCIHAAQLIDPEGKSTGVLRQFSRDRDVSIRDILMLGGRLAATSSYLYPSALRKTGLPAFCTMIPGVGDNPLQLYLATKGTVHYLCEVLSCYRQGHAESWTARTYRSDEKKKIAHWQASIDMYRAFNTYTNLRWNDDVEAAVAVKQISILQAKHDLSGIFRAEYRKAFHSLG